MQVTCRDSATTSRTGRDFFDADKEDLENALDILDLELVGTRNASKPSDA